MSVSGDSFFQPEIFLIVTLSILKEKECYGLSISENIIMTTTNVLQQNCNPIIYRKFIDNTKNDEVMWNKINCHIEVIKDLESDVVLITLLNYKL